MISQEQFYFLHEQLEELIQDESTSKDQLQTIALELAGMVGQLIDKREEEDASLSRLLMDCLRS